MRKAIVIANAAVGFFLIVVLILTFTLPLRFDGSSLDSVVEFGEGWHYADGGDADLMDLQFRDGMATVSHPLDAPPDGKDLCFLSWNVEFTVLADEQKVYEFYPDLGGFYGKFYGNQEHMVMLPTDIREVTVVLHSRYDNSRLGIDKIVLENSSSHVLNLLRTNAPKFLICVVTFFIGLILFFLGLIEEWGRREDMLETMSLGAIAMVLSIWSNFSTHVLQILSGNFASSRVFEHLTLMLLPIPVLIFVGSMTKQLRSPFLYTGLSLSIANIVLQCGLVHTGLRDYNELLILSHLLIVVGIIGVAIMVTHAVRRGVLNQSQKFYLVTALCIIITAGMTDMVRYYIGITEDPAQVSRIGLFLFIMILTVYEFRQLIGIQVRIGEAEILHHLAMEDSLTGLKNRTAFQQYEKEISRKNAGKCLFVQMDVNFLKRVNDTYGHAEGDRHLIAAANVIRESFGQYGTCYRVGGDEFFAILDGADCERDFKRAVAQFRIRQRLYNQAHKPPVPLQLAYGMAVYHFRDQNPEQAEKLADTRMYENKRMLKLANA